MGYTAYIPKILSAQITPNPATINGKAILSVVVIDAQVAAYQTYCFGGDLFAGESPHTPYAAIPQPFIFYSGDIYAGEG